MINLIKFEFKKMFKSKMVYISLVLILIISFLFTFINFKTKSNFKEYNYIEVNKNLNEKTINEIEKNNEIMMFIEQNKINNNDKIKDTLNKHLTFLMFLGFVLFFFSSKVMMGEFDNGTIKNILIKPYSRTQIFFSKYIVILVLSIAFVLITYLLSLIFTSLIYKVNLFKIFTYIYESDIIKVRYINLYTKKFLMYSVPILFLSLLTFNLSIILNSGFFSYIISIILLTFAPSISFILIDLGLKFIIYTFLPYLDYTYYFNKYNLLYINDIYSINISIFKSYVILFFTLLIFTLLGLYIFNKKDIKK